MNDTLAETEQLGLQLGFLHVLQNALCRLLRLAMGCVQHQSVGVRHSEHLEFLEVPGNIGQVDIPCAVRGVPGYPCAGGSSRHCMSAKPERTWHFSASPGARSGGTMLCLQEFSRRARS